ncbi:MAG: 6-phosphogluconolactonase [Porticoccaceae bacterium]
MNDFPVWHMFADNAALDRQLAETVAALLGATIKRNGSALLAVSGGRTPLGFFAELSRQSIPWQQVTVTLADERWVAVDHQDSNEGLAREHLLINAAASARFVGLKNEAATALEGMAACERALQELGVPDVMVLGMGDDGHTASLFPGAEGLAAALDPQGAQLCAAITPPRASHERMTMTLAQLARAHHVFIHITGAAKKTLLEQAADTADPLQLPVAAVLNQPRVPVSVYWSDAKEPA